MLTRHFGRERASICRGLFCLPVAAVRKGLSASPCPAPRTAPPSCTRLHAGAQGRWLQEPLSKGPPQPPQAGRPPSSSPKRGRRSSFLTSILHPPWEGPGHTGTDGAADSAAPGRPLPQPQRAACPGLLATVPHGPLAGCCGSVCGPHCAWGWRLCWGRLRRASSQRPHTVCSRRGPSGGRLGTRATVRPKPRNGDHRGGPCSTPDAQVGGRVPPPPTHPTLVTCHPAGIGRRPAS